MKARIITLCMLALTATAQAQDFTLEGVIGFAGEAEVEEFGNDEMDVEDIFGVSASFTIPLSDRVHLGPRGAYIVADVEDDTTLSSADVGLWLRIEGPGSGLRPFLGLGAGATFFDVEVDHDEGKTTLDGWGMHALGGVGIRQPFKGGAATLGLYYSYQSVPELESDDLEGELEVSVNRMLLMAGLSF